MEKSLYRALEHYQLHLQMDLKTTEQSKINAVFRCKDYLENGGSANKEWLLGNISILAKAVECYRHSLKDQIEDARIIGDEQEWSRLREDRNQMLKLVSLFEKNI